MYRRSYFVRSPLFCTIFEFWSSKLRGSSLWNKLCLTSFRINSIGVLFGSRFSVTFGSRGDRSIIPPSERAHRLKTKPSVENTRHILIVIVIHHSYARVLFKTTIHTSFCGWFLRGLPIPDQLFFIPVSHFVWTRAWFIWN